MLTPRTMTVVGVAMAPLTVVVLDVLLVGPESSSEIVRAIRSSGGTAFVAWTVGLFVGHWFHPGEASEPMLGLPGPPWNYALFGGLTLLVGLFTLVVVDAGSASDWLPTTLAVAGFGVGSLLWPV